MISTMFGRCACSRACTSPAASAAAEVCRIQFRRVEASLDRMSPPESPSVATAHTAATKRKTGGYPRASAGVAFGFGERSYRWLNAVEATFFMLIVRPALQELAFHM